MCKILHKPYICERFICWSDAVLDDLDTELFKNPDNEVLRLNNQSGKLYQQGKIMEAINIGNQLCEIFETRYGQEISSRYSNLYHISLYNLARSYEAAHDYSNAESIYLDLLEYLAYFLGEGSSSFAYLLTDLATMYYKMGEDRESKNLYIKALKILDRVEEKDDKLYQMVLNDYHSRFSR